MKLLVLGCPPAPANDSINSVMHVKTHYKASEWDQFNDSMHKLVKQSYQLLELAVTDRGAYCYRESYEHLCIDQLTWIRMTAQQREIHLCKASSTSIVSPLANIELSVQFSDSSSDLDYSPINISPEEAKVENVPIETVRGIWIKARDLLKTPETVISGHQLTDQDPQTI